MPKLLPCPFCGGEAYYRPPDHISGTAFDCVRVECIYCGASPFAIEVYEGKKDEDKKEAIARFWNTRDNRNAGKVPKAEFDKE